MDSFRSDRYSLSWIPLCCPTSVFEIFCKAMSGMPVPGLGKFLYTELNLSLGVYDF